MEKIRSAFSTTIKQIYRSGWLAGASVAVMSLAFLLATVFTFLAYASNLFLQSIEQEPQIYAFFEIGTEESEINRLRVEWESYDGVAYTDYTSEDQAKQEFYQAQREVNQLAARAVEERELPASLAIRLDSLDYADEVTQELYKEKDTNSNIKEIYFSEDIVNNIREVFFWLRLGGGVILGLSLVVIILFTLLTVEFRMHSRSEEIEIMQLVGGSLGYIRLPFIIEGGIYGLLGAVISNSILGVLLAILADQLSKGQLSYLQRLFGSFDWPALTIENYFILFFGIIAAGFILGAFNSYIAIIRYIK